MKTLEEMLLETYKMGLRCTGIFMNKVQKQWVVNLRHEHGHYDYGYGATPTEAMADGLSRARGEQGPDNRPIFTTAPSAGSKPVGNVEDMF